MSTFPKTLKITVTPQDYADAAAKRKAEDFDPLYHCAVSHAMNRVGREKGFDFSRCRVGYIYGHFEDHNGKDLASYSFSRTLRSLVFWFVNGFELDKPLAGIAKRL